MEEKYIPQWKMLMQRTKPQLIELAQRAQLLWGGLLKKDLAKKLAEYEFHRMVEQYKQISGGSIK